ncbi:MAG: hypothetical protein ACJ8CR_36700 [Roseiflexaceae bacterium]
MARRFARALVPSLADIAFIGVFLLVLWLGQFVVSRDGDLGWHIATGRVILETATVPTQDLFSYTMRGQPFVPHEWLAEVAFAAAYGVGGFDAVVVLAAIVIGATFAGLLLVMLRRGVNPLIAGPLVGLGVIASIAHWAARPHMFTFLFTLLWATALEGHRRGRIGVRGLAWLLPLMLVWVNVHGAFVIGYELAATYLVGATLMWLASAAPARLVHRRQMRDLSLLLALSLVISGVNPVGFELLYYTGNFVSADFLRASIPELQSPDFHSPLFFPLLLLIALALAVSVRREPTPLLLLASWGAFCLYAFRNLPQFVIICLPLIGESAQAQASHYASYATQPACSELLRQGVARLRRIGASLRPGAARSGGVVAALAVVVIAGLLSQGVRFDFWRRGNGFEQHAFPLAAIEHLKPFPPGRRVFNDGSWGGYLIFCCTPQAPPFVDGRVDFYGAAYISDYYRTLNGEPGWREVLDRYQVDWVMIFSDRPLVPWLEHDPAWQRIYADATAVVFVRRQHLSGGPARAPVGHER